MLWWKEVTLLRPMHHEKALEQTNQQSACYRGKVETIPGAFIAPGRRCLLADYFDKVEKTGKMTVPEIMTMRIRPLGISGRQTFLI